MLAADVYTHPDMPGRAGWTWYTGAAGWFLRTVVEELLGLPEDSIEAESSTVGGWTLESFGGFPKEGDSFRWRDYTVTVLEMSDGRRVDSKILPSCQQIALQSLTVADFTALKVVATTLKFGYCFAASAIATCPLVAYNY